MYVSGRPTTPEASWAAPRTHGPPASRTHSLSTTLYRIRFGANLAPIIITGARQLTVHPHQKTMQSMLSLLLTALTANAASIPDAFNPQYALKGLRGLTDNWTNEIKKCPADIPFTCTNDTVISDSCCFEYPGGVLLQTQFWDYYPAVGPEDMFTLHGLWPDRCDGQYDQFCDPSREIHSAKSILESFGETKLLDKMSRVWKNFNGNDESLWVHEFNKHGTCMTTIRESCYSADSKLNQNIVDFYKKSVELFEELPTYEWLAANGIVPSNEQTYTKQQIEDTLTARFGQPVFIKCNRYQAIQEVWYFHHLRGSIVDGYYQPIAALLESQCPENGIKFIPKKGFAPPKPTNSDPSGPIPTGKVLHGYLKPESQPGCIISNGKWYSSGTCAKFTLSKAEFGGYNIKSSKGYCKIATEGFLLCGAGVSPMQFAYDKEKGFVTFGGKTKWSADKIPQRFSQVPISPGYDGPIEFHLKLVSQ